MVKTIQNIIKRLFPEIVSGYHLPQLGRVIRISEPAQSGYNDQYRPMLAVDLQPLKADYTTDTTKKTVLAVPCPLPGAGNHSGFYATPKPGAVVVYSFAYGSNNAPVILQVLSIGLAVPDLPANQMVWQQTPGNHQTINGAGEWLRETASNITDQADTITRRARAMAEHSVNAQSITKINSSEVVGGTKSIEAYQQIDLYSGGQINAVSLSDINLLTETAVKVTATTAIELNADSYNAIIANAHDITAAGYSVKSPKLHIGSDSENILEIISELHDQVKALSDALIAHGHSGAGAGPPTTAANITAVGAQVTAIKARLSPLIG
jgi:hypothetical protein